MNAKYRRKPLTGSSYAVHVIYRQRIQRIL